MLLKLCFLYKYRYIWKTKLVYQIGKPKIIKATLILFVLVISEFGYSQIYNTKCWIINLLSNS